MISQQGEVFEHFDIDVRVKIFLGHWLGQRERRKPALRHRLTNSPTSVRRPLHAQIVATHRRAADQTTQLRRAWLFRAGNEKPTDLVGISGRVALFPSVIRQILPDSKTPALNFTSVSGIYAAVFSHNRARSPIAGGEFTCGSQTIR